MYILYNPRRKELEFNLNNVHMMMFSGMVWEGKRVPEYSSTRPVIKRMRRPLRPRGKKLVWNRAHCTESLFSTKVMVKY